MAYLLLTIFIPVAGAVFYLLFGINYWKRKLYDKKFVEDKKMLDKLKKDMTVYTTESIDPGDISTGNMELATMLARELSSPLTRRNQVKLLINGDEKFPEVLEALRDARHHISTLNITFTSRVK